MAAQKIAVYSLSGNEVLVILGMSNLIKHRSQEYDGRCATELSDIAQIQTITLPHRRTISTWLYSCFYCRNHILR